MARGRGEIRDLLAAHMTSGPEVLEPPTLVTTDDVICYRSRQRIEGREVVAVGTLVFRGGLLWRQTVAFLDAATGGLHP